MPDSTDLSWFIPRADCAVLRFRGADRRDLLQRLSTNDCASLRAGDGIATVLTTVKGRVLDLLQIYERGDDALALCSASQAGHVITHIAKHTITEDVAVDDVTREFAVVAVGAMTGHPELDDVALHGWREESFGDVRAIVVRGIFMTGPGFSIVASAVDADTIALHLRQQGLRLADSGTLTALRVAHGIPGWGAELVDRYNPLECGADDAVSFTKGCYLGQEVIARLHAYKKVQRGLARITLEQNQSVSLPAMIIKEGKEIGEVTTLARDGRGLCVVRKEYLVEGCSVMVGAAIPAVIHGSST